ncbi:lipocalin family protein [Prosthecobacter sp. SYSU 5D2]|uniref:lipocalin family protein n=1 Tax=Prosthecobacter sp. SYSU 5D2 TaxID=3134134 RepID=UPI0031FEBF5C
MKTFILPLFLAGLAFGLASCTSHRNPPLQTATQVDIARYTGHWYELFRLPNSFQRDDSKAEAQYKLQADGTVLVVNTETRPDKERVTVTGTATVVPDGRNSRFRVRFEGPAALAPVPEEGNYWIIKLAPDYSTALVGTPDRKFLWLLSRRPKISAELRSSYEAEAQRLGFDTSKLIHH